MFGTVTYENTFAESSRNCMSSATSRDVFSTIGLATISVKCGFAVLSKSSLSKAVFVMAFTMVISPDARREWTSTSNYEQGKLTCVCMGCGEQIRLCYSRLLCMGLVLCVLIAAIINVSLYEVFIYWYKVIGMHDNVVELYLICTSVIVRHIQVGMDYAIVVIQKCRKVGVTWFA